MDPSIVLTFILNADTPQKKSENTHTQILNNFLYNSPPWLVSEIHPICAVQIKKDQTIFMTDDPFSSPRRSR